MGKKVKLEKIVPSVLYIHVSQYYVVNCHRYTSLKSPISRVKSVSPLVTMTHIRNLSP